MAVALSRRLLLPDKNFQFADWEEAKAMATCLSLSFLPQFPNSFSHFAPSSSSIRCLSPTKIDTVRNPKAFAFHSLIRRRSSLRNTHHRKSLTLRSAVDDVSVIDLSPPPPPPSPPNPELIASLKLKLFVSLWIIPYPFGLVGYFFILVSFSSLCLSFHLFCWYKPICYGQRFLPFHWFLLIWTHLLWLNKVFFFFFFFQF